MIRIIFIPFIITMALIGIKAARDLSLDLKNK